MDHIKDETAVDNRRQSNSSGDGGVVVNMVFALSHVDLNRRCKEIAESKEEVISIPTIFANHHYKQQNSIVHGAIENKRDGPIACDEKRKL